ncbi:MAG: ankyrin repeat protein [Lentimonas sp.]
MGLEWGKNNLYREGKDPTYYAVSHNRIDVAQLLLRNTTHINREYEDGRRLLHVSVLKNLPQMTDLLLENGADANKTDRSKNTSLHFFAHLNFPHLATLLLEAGASVFAKNANNKKPIDVALEGSVVKNILQNAEGLERNQVNNNISAIISARTNPRLAREGNMTQHLPESLLIILRDALVGRPG